MEGGGGLVFARFAFFVAASAAFGSALFPFYAGRSAGEREIGGVMTPILGTSVVALLAALAWLSIAIRDFGGDDLASFIATGKTILFETAFGPAWLARFTAATVLVLLAAAWPRPWPLLLVATVLLGSEGWIGHAADGGIGHRISQVLHVLSAGAWLGALPPLAGVLADGVRSPAGAARARRILYRFSAAATVAVALIAVTGVINRLCVGPPVPEFGTDYDRYFALKIALFLAMVGVAVFNRFRLAPRLEVVEARPKVLKWFWWTVALEQAIGLLLLLVASFLGVASPPQ